VGNGDRGATGPPYDLVGATLTVSSGRAVAGGTPLAGEYIHYQRIGAGTIYVIGDRLDHDALVVDSGSVNARLFANLLGPVRAPAAAQMPVLSPVSLALLSGALALLGVLGRRRFF
jgi:hypothetical protein